MIMMMIIMTASCAFTIVWMQQQISRTASRTKQLEANLAETVRKLNYLDERIATMHQPVVLQGKVAGALRPSTESQIVWVREQTAGANRAYAIAAPYETTMDLAFVDLNQQR